MTTGVNGTPMPSFLDALPPEQRWAITDFIDSLSSSDGPGYTNLVVAKYVQDPIDLKKGAASFETARVARFPIIGQIMEPGRAVPSSHDIRDRSGNLRCRVDRLPRSMARHERAEDGEERTVAARAARGGRRRGRLPAGQAGRRPTEPRLTPSPRSQRRPADQPSEFSDAVSIQIPSQVPTGARKPLLHLWRRAELGGSLVLRSGEPRSASIHGQGKRGHRCQLHGRCHRGRELRPGRMVGHLQATASPGIGRRVLAGRVHADRLLGLGRVFARAWQQARSHGLVLPLRRATSSPIGRRSDGEDSAVHSRHRAGRDRLGSVALPLSRPRGVSASRHREAASAQVLAGARVSGLRAEGGRSADAAGSHQRLSGL